MDTADMDNGRSNVAAVEADGAIELDIVVSVMAPSG
jgi:hypothetical protein